MATVNLYFDDRRLAKHGRSPVRIAIRCNNSTSMLTTSVWLEKNQWDARTNKVIACPNKTAYNNYLTQELLKINEAIVVVSKRCENPNSITAGELKQLVMEYLYPEPQQTATFLERYLLFMNKKSGRTQEIYRTTYEKIIQFDKNIKQKTCEEIDKHWLSDFDSFMSATCTTNTRAIHLRNIRAVFNDAIDDDVTTFYPFRKFKIKRVETAKRSLTVEQMRKLWFATVSDTEKKYLDIFKLTFLLIGINSKDLCYLKGITNNRIEYNRAKTKRLYSVKVEPESAAIIEQYRGKNYLLSILDRYQNYEDYRKRLNDHIKAIAKRNGLPSVTTYWARHTWATIAAEIDIPKETISEALGHQLGSRITSIYINFDQRKVDEANRKVIDYLLYSSSSNSNDF